MEYLELDPPVKKSKTLPRAKPAKAKPPKGSPPKRASEVMDKPLPVADIYLLPSSRKHTHNQSICIGDEVEYNRMVNRYGQIYFTDGGDKLEHCVDCREVEAPEVSSAYDGLLAAQKMTIAGLVFENQSNSSMVVVRRDEVANHTRCLVSGEDAPGVYEAVYPMVGWADLQAHPHEVTRAVDQAYSQILHVNLAASTQRIDEINRTVARLHVDTEAYTEAHTQAMGAVQSSLERCHAISDMFKPDFVPEERENFLKTMNQMHIRYQMLNRLMGQTLELQFLLQTNAVDDMLDAHTRDAVDIVARAPYVQD